MDRMFVGAPSESFEEETVRETGCCNGNSMKWAIRSRLSDERCAASEADVKDDRMSERGTKVCDCRTVL